MDTPAGQAMGRSIIKFRGLWNRYLCHRHRGKSHYQIVLELVAKSISNGSISNFLVKLALKRHGIGSPITDAGVVWPQHSDMKANKSIDLIGGQFFIDLRDEMVWASYRAHFGHKLQSVIQDAEAICRHDLDILGSGPFSWGKPINWHIDPVSGYSWPKNFYFDLSRAGCSPDGSDVKLPWELNRMQHLLTLGKAYRLTQDERFAEEIIGQLSHWFDDNPCPYGINWTCAMDVAIRAMNIIWAYLFIESSPALSKEFRASLAVSLHQHGQFVLFNLEHGFLEDGSIANSNHYLANIIGLLHLGLLLPDCRRAETWQRVGVLGLIEEMDHQVYQDGGDFESSIQYHRLVLELFTAGALLCRMNGINLPERFWQKFERMFDLILFVTRPDGKVPQVGDADDGRLYVLSDYGSWDRSDFRYLLSIGAVLFLRSDMKAYSGGFSEEAFWLLGPTGISSFTALEDKSKGLESRAFADSGLYVMRASNQYLLACCGRVGTGGLGNHKHNDLLSFELYAGDKAFIIDPGAYVYTRDPSSRNLFRSTSYHNTVMIDGEEQNHFEPSQLFRMTDDSSLRVHVWSTTPERDWLEVEHTGYARLLKSVHHRRIFLFEKLTGIWKITDVLTGDGDHTASWFLHFDQGISIDRIGEGSFRTCCEGTNIVLRVEASLPLVFTTIDGWVSRRYGHKLPAKILHIDARFRSTCCLTSTIEIDEQTSTCTRTGVWSRDLPRLEPFS